MSTTVKYIPSSEFYDGDTGLLARPYHKQDIWNLVGDTPFILSIRDTIKKYAAWFGSIDTFELLGKALATAERETYNRLAAKEPRPSDITGQYMPVTTEGSSEPMTWYPEGTDEDARDPVSI